MNSIIYDTGANVSVRNNLDSIRNLESKNMSLVTPVGRKVQKVVVGDTIDGIFKKVIMLKDSVNDIDSTTALIEAGYSKRYCYEEDYYEFVYTVTGDERIYVGSSDGLYHLVEEEMIVTTQVQVLLQVGVHQVQIVVRRLVDLVEVEVLVVEQAQVGKLIIK